MRARARRLRALPPAGHRPRRRLFRLSTLRLVLLLGVAAVLFALGQLGIGIVPHWRDLVLDASEFRLCRNSSQANCVIDGDTIRHDGAVIRIAGIDAPEIYHPRCESERELGKRAARRLLELVGAGPFEIAHPGGRDTDKYGRKLRVLQRNGRAFGDILIAEGLARRWDGAQRSWCG